MGGTLQEKKNPYPLKAKFKRQRCKLIVFRTIRAQKANLIPYLSYKRELSLGILALAI